MADAIVDLEPAIFTKLSGTGGVTALVGSGSNARIYPVKLPQGVTYPAITYQLITDGHEHLMGADSAQVDALVQFDCYGQDNATTPGYEGAKALARQVRLALQRWRDASGDLVIDDSFLDARRDGPYDPEASLPGVYRVSLDFTIFYQEE